LASIKALRDGLKTRLAAVSGIYTHDTIPDDVYPPAAIVGFPTTVRYDFAMRTAVSRYSFPVRVIAGRTTERESQDRIDDLCSPDGASSIRAAVDADPTLGGVAHSSRVVEARDFGVYEVAGVSYIGGEFEIEVIA
jgi:hypothetical protein